ncbi:LOW QUALITY PROTEIN: POU domain, class 5, transcription factor 2 [Glossophaga mutica]
MVEHKPPYSPQPVSGACGPRGPMPLCIDTPIWLSTQAAPGSPMVQPGIQMVVPCESLARVGKVGAWFQSPSEGTFHGPHIILCFLRLELPEISAIEKEMERLAKELRQRRMTLGYLQAKVRFAVDAFEKVLSQMIIYHFKPQQLSLANMWKLQPMLKMWLEQLDTQSLLGLCRMDMILQQAQWRQATRERYIGNNLKLFLLWPKLTPQQISHIAVQLWLPKDLVQVWFHNQSKMGSLPTNGFSPPQLVGASLLFPGGSLCLPLALGLPSFPPNYRGPYFVALYSSSPFPEGGTLDPVPVLDTTEVLPKLSNSGACPSGRAKLGKLIPGVHIRAFSFKASIHCVKKLRIHM